MDYETPETLIEGAASLGFKVTERQIADWRRFGLLPEGKHVGLGRGSETRFPRGTQSQLIAICRLIDLHPRNLARVGWKLWFQGFPVAEVYWRAPLAQVFKYILLIANSVEDHDLTDDKAIFTEELDHAFTVVSERRSLNSGLKQIRRPLGKDGFAELLSQILPIVIGSYLPRKVPSETNDESLKRIAKAFRLGNGAHNDTHTGFLGSNIQAEDFDDKFRDMMHAFARVREPEWLEHSTEAILEARTELISLIEKVRVVTKLEQEQIGDSSQLQKLLFHLWDSLDEMAQAGMILLWTEFRKFVPIAEWLNSDQNRAPSGKEQLYHLHP